MLRFVASFAVPVLTFFALGACNSATSVVRPQDVVFPDSNVSYTRHVEPFLRLGCAFSGCHSSGTPVPLDSYAALFTRPGLLVPTRPESSTLTQVISGTLSHTYSLSGIVTENHKLGMSRWVREGALNN